MDIRSRYSAFNNIPWKLVKHNNFSLDGRILPLHIRMYPTNKCNAKCKWCCYADMDRTLELDYKEMQDIINLFSFLGTKAITFSGGGEPTLHPKLSEILEYSSHKGINNGLVTNGLIWGQKKLNLKLESELLVWARVSVINTTGSYNTDIITNLIDNLPNTNIGVSFVVTEGVNIKLAQEICKIASKTLRLNHIKFIQDSFVIDKDEPMKEIEANCNKLTDKAFFVLRNTPTKGVKNCNVSLLKPVIGADGYVYPCCDVQHAIGDVRDLVQNFRMCKAKDFCQIITPFDGSKCTKCYYGTYNDFLCEMLDRSNHDAFL